MMLCPFCGTTAEAEYVDIGVGDERVTPWGCPECQAYEYASHYHGKEPFDEGRVDKDSCWFFPQLLPRPLDGFDGSWLFTKTTQNTSN
jgi:hypothetical protein